MIKKSASIFLVLSLILNICYIDIYAAEGDSVGNTVSAEYIVRYNETELIPGGEASLLSEDITEAVQQAIKNNLSTAENVTIEDDLNASGTNKNALVKIDTTDKEKTIKELMQTGGILYAEPNCSVTAYTNDTEYSKQWALNGSSNYGVNLGTTTEKTAQGNEIIVAVADTGIDIDHEDLSGSIYTNAAEISDGTDNDGNGFKDDIHGWNFIADNNNVYDNAANDSHGTHVAGIIAAQINNGKGIAGVTNKVKILPLKFMSGTTGDLFNAIKAIEYAKAKGVSVINCSWGTENYSQFLYDTMKNSNMLFVCASGNDSSDTAVSPCYPAAYGLDNEISVASTDKDGNIAETSNYGDKVDIAAPGVDIYSTLPGNTYGNMSGTSMAAPYVTAGAAAFMSVCGYISPDEVKERIKNTAAYNASLKDKVLSEGIVNISELVNSTEEPNSMQEGRYGAGSTVYGNRLYVFGGYDGNGYINSASVFEPEPETWVNKASMQEGVAYFAMGEYNGNIITTGGYNGNIRTATKKYNIADNTWSDEADIPEALYASAYTVSGSKLYVFGGIGENGYSKSVYVYDIVGNTWTKKNDMPKSIAYGKAAAADGKIYIIGGCNENGCFRRIYRYDPADDTYTNVSELNTARKDFACEYYGGKIYIYGGSNTYGSHESILNFASAAGTYIGSVVNSAEVYNISDNTCEEDNTAECAAGATGTIYNGKLYFVGGWDGEYRTSAEKYFGSEIPSKIRITTSGSNMVVKWNRINEAQSYRIEIDGEEYSTTDNMYVKAVDGTTEHRIRIKSVSGAKESYWSDYAYYSPNSTMLDAKVIKMNSTNEGNLYKNGETKWYKLINLNIGKLTATLSNIPNNCNYLIQLFNMSGNIIATGKSLNNIQEIKNIVINPCPYYIKIFSTYGYSNTFSYTLAISFADSSYENIPDRVRNVFLKSSNLNDLSLNNTQIKNLSEYNGKSTPPPIVEEKQLTKTKPEVLDSGSGTQEYIEEETSETDENNQTSLMGIDNYYEEKGKISVSGNTATGSITVPAYAPTSSQRCKVVIEVIPDNVYDKMRIEWIGGNTNYKNFWRHSNECDGNFIYYLSAILNRSSTSKVYNYKITCDRISDSSTGNYTIKKYIKCDSNTNEDFNNINGINDVPKYAENATPELNSHVVKIGTIDHQYDSDCYYVTASSNEKITAYLQSPNGKKYDVAIYDNRCTGNDFSSSEYMDGCTDEKSSYATIKGKSQISQKYCIVVDTYDGTYSADNTYTLFVYKYNISQLGDLEVNDSFEDADDLKSNTAEYLGTSTKIATPIRFNIDSPVDSDIYAVDMEKGEKLSIKMDLPTNYVDFDEKYRIEIYNVFKKYDNVTIYELRSYDNDSEYFKYVTFIPDKTDTYYIVVRSLKNEQKDFEYGTLTVAKTSKNNMDSYETKGNECSNDFAFFKMFNAEGIEYGFDTTSNIGTIVNANFDNEMDVDWYKFTSDAKMKTTTISIDGSTFAMNAAIGIAVFDSSYRLLTIGVSGNTYTFEPNQTYYIAAYVNDNKYSDILSNRNYSMKINLNDLRNDLIFNQIQWGTFVYDNDPEFLTDDDMADYDLGNRFLMSADGLSGIVDFQSSHSAKQYMLEEGNIGFDILMYNPTDQIVSVDVDRIGYQLPCENSLNGNIDWTTTNWACLKAWADFLQINIVGDMLIGREKNNYKDYFFKYLNNQLPNRGHYEIEPGRAVWMLEAARPIMKNKKWSPFNFVSRIKISNGGMINMGLAAFRDINKVYTPKSSKLIYDTNTQRKYPANLPYSEKEHDVNGKPKGIAGSVAETVTKTQWIISDNNNYFMPTLYNYTNPNGYKLSGTEDDYWITNFNPNADAYGFNCGVENDILPLYFSDKDNNGNIIRNWVFDNRHTNPLSGNENITGVAPVLNAMPLGNYGVLERYIIDLTNSTSSNKTVSYIMNTASHAVIRYKDGDGLWNTKIKVGEIQRENETDEYFDTIKKKTIFKIDLQAGETKQLKLEVILPNADGGGLRHQLECH